MRTRRGYTLIEVMTVVAVLGAFMALIATTISAVLQLDATARREMGLAQAMGIWELQLREDMHGASDVWLDGGILKSRPDATRTIQWEATPSHIVRQLWEADSLLTEERWPLPYDYQANWQLNAHTLQLTLVPADEARSKPLGAARDVHLEIGIHRLPSSSGVEEQP